MRVPRPLLLAFVGSLALVESKYVPSIDHDALDTAGTNHPKSPGLAEKYALPAEQCSTWVGIEKIFMVETIEVCPDGSTATTTLTSCVSTLTRSICATATSSRPCYPCVMSTLPTSSDLATVTMTSYSCTTTPPSQTLTLTIQFCSTCAVTIYIGTVPGYTPGGPCHGCVPYTESESSLLPCTESEGGGGGGGVGTGTGTTTTTSITTSTVCDDGSDTTGGGGGSTSEMPGNSGMPMTMTMTSCLEGGAGTTAGVVGSGRATVSATAAPPVVTAGGGRNGVGGLVGAWLCVWVVVVILGV